MSFANDTFTGVDGTLLDAHTSDSGATWTKRTGSGATTLTINTNRINCTSNASNAWYYSSASPASADYSVQADATCTTAAAIGPAICGRMATGATTHYELNHKNGAWGLNKEVAGTRTVLGSFSDAAAPAAVTIILRMTGTTIVGNIAGVDQITVTDSAIAGAGQPGVGTVNSDIGATRYLDNWSATDAASAFSAKFRKTLSSFGSGVGKRQAY